MKTKQPINRFLTAQAVSLFGSALVQYALIWQVTLKTSSGKALMISTICGFLPQLAVSLLAGVFADRYSRKWVIIASDSLIAAATLFLIFMGTGLESIYLVLALRSLGSGIQNPAVQSTLPALTEASDLPRVNGLFGTVQSAISFLAPACSGFLLAQVSFRAVLWIDIMTALIGICLTISIPFVRRPCSHQKQSLWMDMKGGFYYLNQTGWLKALLLYQYMIMFLISPTAFMTPLCVSRVFGEDIWRLSLAEMTYSLGMIAGGIFMAKNPKYGRIIKTTLMAGMFYGFCMIGMGTLKIALLFYLANTLIGISSPCYQVPLYTHLQSKIPPDKQGRVFGMLSICNSLAMPLGMVIFGPLADILPVGMVFAGCGCLVVTLSMIYTLKRKVISG